MPWQRLVKIQNVPFRGLWGTKTIEMTELKKLIKQFEAKLADRGEDDARKWLAGALEHFLSTARHDRGNVMGLLNWLKSRIAHQPLAAKDVASFDEQGVRLLRRDGTAHSVQWDDLQAVYIDTTNLGPFIEDVFFVLVTNEWVYHVPQGATGMDELSERLGKLPGFDGEAVCRAMCCTDNNHFVCWKREKPDQKL